MVSIMPQSYAKEMHIFCITFSSFASDACLVKQQ